MGPVCSIMVGRLDDWLKVLIEKQDIAIDPGIRRVVRRWAVFKRRTESPSHVADRCADFSAARLPPQRPLQERD